MNKKLYLPLFLLMVSKVFARSSFWSSSHSSSFSSEQEMVNGQLIKDRQNKENYGDEIAGEDGKIIYERSDDNKDIKDVDPLLGIKVSGEDYLNYKNDDNLSINNNDNYFFKILDILEDIPDNRNNYIDFIKENRIFSDNKNE